MNNLKHIGVKGEGYFCIVKKFQNEISGNYLAVKELKKKLYSNSEYRYRLEREIKILKDLQGCPNIIELIDFGHDKTKEKLWYMMPFADKNLYDFIKTNHAKLNTELRFNIVEQIITGLKFAHNKDILHRDISPSNVLIFKGNNKIIVKLSDFGLGKDEGALSYYTKSSVSGYGQILYVSPEQRASLKSANKKSDVFSLGKLIYFVFTGKDPDNSQQFELSSLVIKATNINPEKRHDNIEDLEAHFAALKDLLLNNNIVNNYVTLKEYAKNKEYNWHKLHELLVKGNYTNHVYDDYIEPVNTIFIDQNNINEYYKNIGTSVNTFVQTYSERLSECYGTVRWPFNAMSTFGVVLTKIIKNVDEVETRLICLKQLWTLAFSLDQWSVQDEIKNVFNTDYISSEIEIQISEHIIKSNVKVEIEQFSNQILPQTIKASILKVNEKITNEELERKAKQELQIDDFDW